MQVINSSVVTVASAAVFWYHLLWTWRTKRRLKQTPWVLDTVIASIIYSSHSNIPPVIGISHLRLKNRAFSCISVQWHKEPTMARWRSYMPTPWEHGFTPPHLLADSPTISRWWGFDSVGLSPLVYFLCCEGISLIRSCKYPGDAIGEKDIWVSTDGLAGQSSMGQEGFQSVFTLQWEWTSILIKMERGHVVLLSPSDLVAAWGMVTYGGLHNGSQHLQIRFEIVAVAS